MPFDAPTALAVLAYVASALLPGLALMRLLGAAPRDWTVRLGAALGLGLALHPVLMLWARTLGLPLGPWAWAALVGVGAIGAMPSLGRDQGGSTRAATDGGDDGAGDAHPTPGEREPSRQLAAIALAVVAGVALLARWTAAEAVRVPYWGDSVHHAMIVRLIASHGGLVHSWLPEVPLATFTYHFGLHAGVAGLTWLTGLAPERALIVAGQVLMVLQVLTAYALAAGLTGRRWAGVGAAIAAAGLSPMPAYYVSWGRYTQLAGQVVLPAAALLVFRAASVRSERRVRNGAWAAAALTVAGLALTHYLVTPMFALLALAWWFVGAIADPRAALGRLLRLAGIAAAAVAVAAPWLPSLADGLMVQAAVAVSTEALAPAVYGAAGIDAVRAALPEILAEHARLRVGWPLLVAAALGALWGLWRRERLALVGLSWTALLVVAAYPWLVGLPLGAVLKDFTVAIGLYLPLGLVVGGALGDAVARADARWPWRAHEASRADAAGSGSGSGSNEGSSERASVASVAGGGADATGAGRPGLSAAGLVATAAVVFAAVAAFLVRAPEPDPAHRLVTPADEAAIAWVRANTPSDARFLVSGFLAFGDTVAAGDDAGWWLPQLADRATTLPPITYGLERPIEPGYREAINAVYARLPAGIDDPELTALLEARGVTHAFVGETARALDGDALSASPRWRAVYDEGGVRVFERVTGSGTGGGLGR